MSTIWLNDKMKGVSMKMWVVMIRAAAIQEIPMTEPLVVRRETYVAAPPATVFAFLTDPEKIVSWMGVEATTEMHPGGLYLLKGVSSRGRVARVAFREVVPVHRLA